MKDTIVKELINITKINLDKIKPTVFYNINEEYFLIKEQKEKDNFAIEFAEWCAYYQIGKVKDELWISNLLAIANHYETYTMKQLIKKFKKEKNK